MNIYQRLLVTHLNIRQWGSKPESSFIYAFLLMKEHSLLKKQCV